MQTAVTVVNLIHDTVTETDRPVCWVFAGCSWRECRSTSGSGTAKDHPHPHPGQRVHHGLSALRSVDGSACGGKD